MKKTLFILLPMFLVIFFESPAFCHWNSSENKREYTRCRNEAPSCSGTYSYHSGTLGYVSGTTWVIDGELYTKDIPRSLRGRIGKPFTYAQLPNNNFAPEGFVFIFKESFTAISHSSQRKQGEGYWTLANDYRNVPLWNKETKEKHEPVGRDAEPCIEYFIEQTKDDAVIVEKKKYCRVGKLPAVFTDNKNWESNPLAGELTAEKINALFATMLETNEALAGKVNVEIAAINASVTEKIAGMAGSEETMAGVDKKLKKLIRKQNAFRQTLAAIVNLLTAQINALENIDEDQRKAFDALKALK